MSEPLDSAPGVETDSVEAVRINPGEILRAERLRAGLGAAEVATHLRLKESILGHIEAGRFDRLPGNTFARGYVRAYARLLKLDANSLVLAYDRYVGIDKRESKVNTIDRVDTAPRRGAQVVMWLSTLVVIIIMVALGLWWWSDSRSAPNQPVSRDTGGLMDEVQVDSMALPETFNPGLSERMLAPPLDDSAAAAEIPPAGEEVVAPTMAADPVAEPAAVSESAETPAQAASSDQTGLLMTFSDNCWIQVSIPGGRVLHSSQMQEGQTLDLAHQGPLDLVVGAAHAVSRIEYNGQPVELKVNSQSSVARLRLGQ